MHVNKKSDDPMMIHLVHPVPGLVLVKKSEKQCCGGHCDSESLPCASDVAHDHHHHQIFY